MNPAELLHSVSQVLGLAEALAIVGGALALVLVPILLLLREYASSRPGAAERNH